MAHVAFIGLGNMGLPMAQNLIKAGHQVTGVDLSAAAKDKLKASGGALADSAGAAATQADWAAKVAANIRTKSPTSLKIALAQMRRGARWSFAECMMAEFRIVSRIVHGHDFYEGVRAAIIDKDNAPRWRPAALDAVTPEEVERYFAALDSGELALP
jgi:enoyl-CoA hydratase